jgi:hypothetical protein
MSVEMKCRPNQSHVFRELGQHGFCIMMQLNDTSKFYGCTVRSPLTLHGEYKNNIIKLNLYSERDDAFT